MPIFLNRLLQGWIQGWIQLVARHAYWVLIITCLLGIGALSYSSHHLGFNTNTNTMLAADLPFRASYQRFEQAFPQYTHNILVVIDAASPEKSRDAAQRLAALLKQQPQLFSSVYLPRANSFMERHALLYQAMDELEEISDNLATMQPFLGRLTADFSLRGLLHLLDEVLTTDAPMDVDISTIITPIATSIHAVINHQHAPLSWQELMQEVSDEEVYQQRQQFILLQPVLDFSTFLAAKPAITAVRDAAKVLQLNRQHHIRVRLTGSAALSNDELHSISQGAGMAALFSLLLVAILLTIGLGSFRLVVATLLCLVTGLLFTATFAAITIGHLNLISVAFAVLYIGLGVDYAIHVCLRCQEIEHTGVSTPTALKQASRSLAPPLLLCTVTTAVGFYCFVPTDYTGVSELGIISGSSMFISLVLTLTLLPAILYVWNDRFPTKRVHAPIHRALVQRNVLTAFSPRHYPRLIRWVSLLLALAAALWLPQASFDYNPINLRDQSSESVTTYNDLVANHHISPSSIMILTSDAAQLHRFQQQLKGLHSVDKTISLFDLIPSGQPEKLAIIDEMTLLLGLNGAIHHPTTQTLDAQQKAITALTSSLTDYIATHESTSDVQPFNSLRHNLQQLSHTLQHASTATQRNLLAALQDDLLGTLPNMLDLLAITLTATPIQMQNIPTPLRQRWLSDSGIYRIEVIPKENIGNIKQLREFVNEVRSVAPEATGGPVFTLEAGDAVIHAFIQAFSLAFLLIFLLLLLLQRSLADTLLTLLPLLLASLLTVTGAIWLNIPFNFAKFVQANFCPSACFAGCKSHLR